MSQSKDRQRLKGGSRILNLAKVHTCRTLLSYIMLMVSATSLYTPGIQMSMFDPFVSDDMKQLSPRPLSCRAWNQHVLLVSSLFHLVELLCPCKERSNPPLVAKQWVSSPRRFCFVLGQKIPSKSSWERPVNEPKKEVLVWSVPNISHRHSPSANVYLGKARAWLLANEGVLIFLVGKY